MTFKRRFGDYISMEKAKREFLEILQKTAKGFVAEAQQFIDKAI